MPRTLIRSVSPSMLISSSHKAGSPSIFLKDCSQQTGSYGVLRDGAASAAAEAPLRRSSSLDAVCPVAGWPRERTALSAAVAATARPADKATQTPDEWAAIRSRSSPLAWGPGLVSPSGDHREKKLIRQRLQRSGKDVAGVRMWSLAASVRHSPVPGDHSLLLLPSTATAAAPIPIPCGGSGRPPTTPPRTRSSVEGLNQEIERLVQQRVLSFSQQCPVDGHLAPVDELLMRARRSVNTQTPVEEQLMSPTLHDMEALTLTGGSSKCSTPDLESGRLGSSPQINRFLARAPPDGCERVNLRTGETGRRPVPLDPLIKPAVFELKPSLGSAFSRPAFRKRSDDSTSALPSPAKPPIQLKAAALSKS